MAACENSDNDNIGTNARQDSSLETLSQRLEWVEQRLASVERNAHAVVTPDDKGFVHLTDGAINVTIAMHALRQQGSAVEADLAIGNLTSASLKDCRSMVSVRKAKDGDFEQIDFIRLGREFMPGTLTNTIIALPDLKVDEISALRFSTLGCNTVSLRP